MFNWKKALGYGALIWVIMFAVASALVQVPPVAMTVVIIVVSVALAYVFAGKVGPLTVARAFAYGGVWALVGIILDFFITTQFAPTIFSQWVYWVDYALIVLAVVARSKARHSQY